MRAQSVIACAVACVVGVGCERSGGDASAVLDQAKILQTLSTRLEAVVDSPEVSGALESTLDSIVSAPDVAEAGGAFFATLSSDPEIAAAAATLFETLGATREMEVLLGELMQQHPGLPPDEIAALVGDHVDKAFSDPAFNTGWMLEFDRVLAQLRTHPDALVLASKARGAIDLSHLDGEIEHKWGARIVKLAGDKAPSRDRGTALWEEHFWKDRRVEKVVAGALSSPGFRKPTNKAVSVLLRHEAFTKNLHASVAVVLADPVANKAIEDILIAGMASPSDSSRMLVGIRALLDAPSTKKAIDSALHLIATDPAIAKVGVAWVGDLRRDPALRGAYDKFWFGW